MSVFLQMRKSVFHSALSLGAQGTLWHVFCTAIVVHQMVGGLKFWYLIYLSLPRASWKGTAILP